MNSLPTSPASQPVAEPNSSAVKVSIEKWFVILKQLVPGLKTAYIEIKGNAMSGGGLVMTFPKDIRSSEELALAAQLALRSGAPVTGRGEKATELAKSIRIAFPLQLDADVDAVLVVDVNAPLNKQPVIMKLLKLSGSLLDFALNAKNEPEPATSMGALVDAGREFENYHDTLVAVLAQLSSQVHCTRVSLGRKDGNKVSIDAVSGVSQLSHRSTRIKTAERVMQAAVDADNTLVWPEASGYQSPSVLPDFIQSCELSGACVVPLTKGFRSPLVFLFEYTEKDDWHGGLIHRCDEAARVAAPFIELKRDHYRPWRHRFLSLFHQGLQQLLGPEGRFRRSLLAVALLGVVFLAIGQTDHRVSAPAVIEGAVQRAVVAPYDGFIEQAEVRAGQRVKAGDLMARLDDRELQEERRRLQAEVAELVKEHRQAVAVLDRSKASIVDARKEQAQARLQLVEDQLTRIELRAPFDGIIISGDWSRSLGVPVTRGDLIFEVAPLDDYRIALKVNDRDIAAVTARQNGEVILTAQPDRPIAISITEITTLAETDSTEPSFRVEAEPKEVGVSLRPGMEGLAKISVGQRQRWWVWTHKLTDWIRLQYWRWMP